LAQFRSLHVNAIQRSQLQQPGGLTDWVGLVSESEEDIVAVEDNGDGEPECRAPDIDADQGRVCVSHMELDGKVGL